MHDLTAIFTRTTDAVGAILDNDSDPQAETPCPEWTYGQLLGHLVGGDRMVVTILSGAGRPPATPRLAPDADQAAPALSDYQTWTRRAAELLSDPQLQTSTHTLPVGDLTGSQVALLRSVEHLLHGWDLARAAGVPTADLDPLATVLGAPAQQLLAAVGSQNLGDRRPFADPVEVGSDSSDLSRFVAMFGRDPHWEPDPVAGYGRLQERFVDHDDVELPDGSRRGFGADGMRVRNQVFACTYRNRLMIKLPEGEVDELIGQGLGLPLAKPGQRPMRQWVLVPFDGAAGPRVDRAYAFVRG